MKKKGKAIGIVLVAALLVGLTIGSSMAETLIYHPLPGVTWKASTSMWGTGSTHSSQSELIDGDANIDEIGVHGRLRVGGSNGKVVDEDWETNYNDNYAEVNLYSFAGPDYAEADHTFEAPPYRWHPSTSDSI